MDIERRANTPGGEETRYSNVTISEAEQLLTEARDFVNPQGSEMSSETIVVRTTMFSVRDGLVRRATIEHDVTHGTVEVTTKTTTETHELWHANH